MYQARSNKTLQRLAKLIRWSAERMPFTRTLILIALILIVSISYCSSVSAVDYYVDNVYGNDTNEGTTPIDSTIGGRPFKTITRALKSANRGDRVILARNDQPYKECITLEGSRNSGSNLHRFELIGNGATLDGSVGVSQADWKHFKGNVFRYAPLHPSHQILFLNHRPAERYRSDNLLKMKAMQWALRDGHVYFCVEKDRQPRQYDLSICGHQVGITLYQVRKLAISGLIVQGFRLDGVNAHDLVVDAEIHSSNLRGNGRSGISVGGASRFRIAACLLGNNGSTQLRTEGYCKVESQDVDLVEDEHALRIEFEGGRLQHNGQTIADNLR